MEGTKRFIEKSFQRKKDGMRDIRNWMEFQCYDVKYTSHTFAYSILTSHRISASGPERSSSIRIYRLIRQLDSYLS